MLSSASTVNAKPALPPAAPAGTKPVRKMPGTAPESMTALLTMLSPSL